MEKVLCTLALLTSFYSIFVGLACQVIKNYKRKSVEGFSLNLFISIYAIYFFWMFYGFSKPGIDYVLVVPNFIGLIIGSFLLYQFIAYRQPKKK